MKFLLSLGLALAVSASAQVFRPQVQGGQRGPAAPAPAARVDAHRHFDHGRSYGPRFGAVLYPGGYGYSRYYSAPVFGYYDGYSAYDYPYYFAGTGYYGSGSAASSGLLLGALAGGIIGHNSGEFRHNGWRGAAWGAGLGLLLGGVVDANRRTVAAPVYSYPQPPQPVVLPAASAPVAAVPTQPTQVSAQPVTIINNYYGNAVPMSGANALFGR